MDTAARTSPLGSGVIALLSALATVVALAIVVMPEPARADGGAPMAAVVPAAMKEPVQEDPSNFTADALPTVQINGVVWDQEIVGDIVYAAGSFSSARPAGSPAGSNEVPRANLLAYRLSTGELIASFAPTLNAQVRSVASSPDGSRLYVVGDFTSVNGQSRNRVAAFDLPSGSLSSFNPNSNGTTIGVDATNSTVYLTGNFGRVSGQDRMGAAAVSRDGSLLPWAPVLGERRGRVVLASPDGSKVVLGGDFPTLNGSSNPGYGLGMVRASDAALVVPFQVNDVIRNGGKDAAILSLKSDADSFYGTGYTFGAGGNLEGSFRASWDSGGLTWVNDCHGDHYDVQPIGDAVYMASHAHYCGSLENGFPQSNPWSFYRATAVTKDVERVTPSGLNQGYYDFGGNPAPRLLHWFPSLNSGTYTGQYQGPWSVSGTSDYLVYGGEFTRVNNTSQQGLVRFASKDKAPNAQGPLLWNTDWPATAVALEGAVRVSWPTNFDRDSELLTYELTRDGTVIKTFEDVRSKSKDWGLAPMSYMDAAIEDGRTYTYRVRAMDAEGHSINGGAVTITATGTTAQSAYRDAVLADGPLSYWPLDDNSGPVSYDWAGASDLSMRAGVSRGVGGAILGEPRTAASFDGSSEGYAASSAQVEGPNTFGVEAWFRTTSNDGGKIVGFGNRNSGDSNSYDRHVYMQPDGRVVFGVYPGAERTVGSTELYNDGEWHHVAAGLSEDGMEMYIDGVRVGRRADTTSAQGYSGYWRVGGDSTWAGSSRFTGQIDEVAIYGAPLSRSQIAKHYEVSGRSLDVVAAPTDPYGASVFSAEPELYWRLGEAGGTVALDSSGMNNSGSVVGAVQQGVDGALTDVDNSAVNFEDGQVISQRAVTNPTTYSLEAWFKTSTTTGGKIIGFGDSATGNSGNYDRHVYMTDAGNLTFGVWAGSEQSIRTEDAYNDGNWHHMVATQGSSGMVLYVDGQQAGTNSATGAQGYTGYWHVGGDTTWGPGDSAFDGTIDEVAVYSAVLSADDVTMHHSLGTSGAVPNVAPEARFDVSASKLTAAVDASQSSDSDGDIVSYSWDWGDGSDSSSGATAEHAYAEGGTYTVTLVVTDDRAGTDTATQTVAVAPNQQPVSSFTTRVAGLDVEADASSSIDTDGTIASYDWDWGDGATESAGASASHSYAADGEYTITLTVTDDGGAEATTSLPVTVAAPSGSTVYAQDGFNRTETAGLGAADEGGAWTLSNNASNYRVDGSSAVFLQPAGGSLRHAYLPSVASTDTSVRVDMTLPQLPVGGSSYSTVHMRRVGAVDYRARMIVAPNGNLTVQLQQTSSVLVNAPTTLTMAGGDTVHVRAEASGTSPTTLRFKVWKAGTDEPEDWTATATDSTAVLQAPGDVGLGVYLGGGATRLPFQTNFDNFRAASTTEGELEVPEEPAENVEPVASFVAEVAGSSVSVDGSASSDPDGTVASYSWDFGDGAVGEGVTAEHEFGSAGTYTVTLTVTDDRGATATSQEVVEIPEPAQDGVLAADGFDRAEGVLGESQFGGAWTQTSGAANVGIEDGQARFTSQKAGQTRTATLRDILTDSTDMSFSFSTSEEVQNGRMYVSAIGRTIGAEDYRGRWIIDTNGRVQAQLSRGGSALAWTNLSGIVIEPGKAYKVRLQVYGSGETTLRSKIWEAGSDEPSAWQLSTTDSTPALQQPGYSGISTYAGGGIDPTPYNVYIDDLEITEVTQ